MDTGDPAYPGNKIRQYVFQKLKYMNFHCTNNGQHEKPNDVLRCMRELRAHDSRLQHSFRAADILTDDEFKQAFWNIFPTVMHCIF